MALSNFSCKKGFLDQVPDDKLTIDAVFKTKSDLEKYLSSAYLFIQRETDWRYNILWEPLSDECDVSFANTDSYDILRGNWTRNTGVSNMWSTYYKGIRTASYFIQRAPECQNIDDKLLRQYMAEARALRAYFYFCLMKQYGPVVLNGEFPAATNAPLKDITIPRSSFDECVDYVSSELDKAAGDLPLFGSNDDINNYGRITKAFCLAVKARMLLYAASPLFNGNTDYASFQNKDGKQLINQTYDANKWKKAADASKAVIDLNIFDLYKEYDTATGKINPYASYRNMLLKDWNSEVIFSSVTDMTVIDQSMFPRSLNGWYGFDATQSVVDGYFMASGLSPITGYDGAGNPVINPASGYTETGFSTTNTNVPNYPNDRVFNMFVGREPRFYVSISYHGSRWLNNEQRDGTFGSQPIIINNIYNNGLEGGYNGNNCSRTGYAIRKGASPSTDFKNGTKVAARNQILYRLGEVYLNYVEALNEFDPGNADIVKYLNLIRERAGIPGYGATGIAMPAGQDGMRDAIRKERRVELAFENLRYFDTRRWKIASQTDNGPIKCLNFEGTDETSFLRRNVFKYVTRVWSDKYYLWNIVQSEIDKNPNLVENPGW